MDTSRALSVLNGDTERKKERRKEGKKEMLSKEPEQKGY
jgi:hypothetical protein